MFITADGATAMIGHHAGILNFLNNDVLGMTNVLYIIYTESLAAARFRATLNNKMLNLIKIHPKD